MTHIKIKLLVAGVALTTAVVLLAVAGAREGWVYYLPVDEFVANESYQVQRVRLHGTVATDGLEVQPALLLARFDLLGETTRVRIEYSGVVPDLFEAEREVVVEGRLGADGVFAADTMLTKCASKYESTDGETPHAAPQTGETKK